MTVAQRVRHLQARGAAVQHHGLTVGDQRGHVRGDPLLGRDGVGRAQHERRLLAAEQQGPGAAAEPFEHALVGQGLQVTADGHLRRAGQGRQLGHGQLALATGRFRDQPEPVRTCHGGN
ncbi:hypothetical protein GCM10029964_030520 [Kibdelosporangium lantanae]